MPLLKRKKGESKAGQAVRTAMHERKRGELHSGSKTGPIVRNKKQAIAIGLSEARKAGAKVPKKKAAATKDTDETALKMHKFHSDMAERHRAHADLIEAKLRTKGKRIRHGYGNEKTKIVPNADG